MVASIIVLALDILVLLLAINAAALAALAAHFGRPRPLGEHAQAGQHAVPGLTTHSLCSWRLVLFLCLVCHISGLRFAGREVLRLRRLGAHLAFEGPFPVVIAPLEHATAHFLVLLL